MQHLTKYTKHWSLTIALFYLLFPQIVLAIQTNTPLSEPDVVTEQTDDATDSKEQTTDEQEDGDATTKVKILEQDSPVEWVDIPASSNVEVEDAAMLSALLSVKPVQPHHFLDITDAVGLSSDIVGTGIARSLFADLNNDGFSDIVLDRSRVFLNVPDTQMRTSMGRAFLEVDSPGLPDPRRGDQYVFADLNNDDALDAIVIRHIDPNNQKWIDEGLRSAWYQGNGDGTFDPIGRNLVAVTEGTASCVAINDIDRDGLLDMWVGHWYTRYGSTYAGWSNDCLLQVAWPDVKEPTLETWNTWVRQPIPSDGYQFTEKHDRGGSPTYGSFIADLNNDGQPELLELNYGRRWNRCWSFENNTLETDNEDNGQTDPQTVEQPWSDIAPKIGFDGDSIRHGKHPEWLKERAKTDPRFDRADELPFRANGNSFDLTIGDIDNDGDFDLFIAEITHGWAGESADRSRFLLNQLSDTNEFKFTTNPALSVDRIPEGKNNWNQGDLFCQLADMDNDGKLDLLLASGDYPDEQLLRLYIQQPDGTFNDTTRSANIDQDGAKQISLADINGDGALDILVGQTFFRYPAELKEGRVPTLKLYLNQPPNDRNSVTLYLKGNIGSNTNHDAIGAIVRAELSDGTTLIRQHNMIGGHSGKQMGSEIHFGIGLHDSIDRLVIIWPNKKRSEQVFTNVAAGRYKLIQNFDLEPMLMSTKTTVAGGT